MIPDAVAGQVVVAGPERSGSERRWRVRLPDGRPAVLAQLLPELARDDALRRRYARDAERLAALEVDGLAKTLAVGPQPDPRDPAAEPPWRLREDPPGETLEEILAARAPLPVDEAVDLAARLCDLLERVHARGAVLRDLKPRQLVVDGERLMLTDVGLARLDILSTRTATSLILEGSPYAAPEHLRSRLVNARADLFSVGIILWRALTGTLPFGDGPAFLREHAPLPPLERARPGAPAELGAVVAQLLAEKPEERPPSARETAAVLRGEPQAPRSMALVVCQACGARLRAGLRLCLSCGKQAVQLHHTADQQQEWWLDLTAVREAAVYLDALQEILATVSSPPLPSLNFITEDQRMYSKEEKQQLIKLPARLFDGLSGETAADLQRRMKKRGLQVKITSAKAMRKRRRVGILMTAAGVGSFAAVGVSMLLGLAGIVLVPLGLVHFFQGRKRKATAILTLRPAPSALPASDPLIARLGALLAAGAAADVREQVTEIAVLVQRLVEHRAVHLGAAAEIEVVTRPVDPLVAVLEKQVAAIGRLDRELAELDEETLVRALAASEARGEPAARREPLLTGLDRLRALEDQRGRHMQRLLEASTLLRRAVAIGLRVADPDAAERAELELARAALDLDAT